ncbi:MAG: inorganic phosphate transporter, partial [bacterium]|nr:inorganic phosphate transporter [bacterium]
MLLVLLVVCVFFLAWANGANDNFKGVATLYGSGTTTFRTALIWATGATLAGSVLSVAFASKLVSAFRGKGLVPDEFLGVGLLVAVAGAGAATILLATFLGMPTSTTHALTGALVGAGLAAAGTSGVGWGALATKFAQPLLLSPLLSIAFTALLYVVFRFARERLQVEKETCVCVGERGERELVPLGAVGMSALAGAPAIEVGVGQASECVERYAGRVFGIRAQGAVDFVHYLSAGAVCFARAVNDTPKIAALLFGVVALGSSLTTPVLGAVALAMAAGGWLHSRKVAETMSKHITELNTGQGLTANLMTAVLVLGASRIGVPVSTTHVSCGAIFGIGLVNGKLEWSTIGKIAATWLTT